jgi:hypothetical protein
VVARGDRDLFLPRLHDWSPDMTQRGPLDLRTQLTRRRLLGGLGAATVALTSPIWKSSTVFGQDAKTGGARRFIGIFSANGTIASDFFAKTDAAQSPLTLGQILSPLSEHLSRLLVLKGVHMNSTIEDELGVEGALKPGGPHMKGPGAMLTGGSLMEGTFTGAGGPAGYADRISVDQFIANRIGSQSRYPSLEFGVRIEGQEPLRVISYRGANQPNIAVDDPWKIYARLFADTGLSDAALAQRLKDGQSVLDFLKDDLGRLRGRVDATDQARLDAHLTGLRNIEKRLSDTAAVGCMPLAMPEKADPRAMENYPLVGKLQTDLMVLAHRCDLTRVSTFMWANADSWQYYPWIGVNEEHHELSHAGDDDEAAREKLIKINAWHAEQVAYLLDQLAESVEVDGTSLLDNSLVLWGNEIGVGNTHTYKDIPWLIAAGSATGLDTGRFLKFADRPHNDLLVSVCNAMGLADVETFGIPGVCTGGLPGLFA